MILDSVVVLISVVVELSVFVFSVCGANLTIEVFKSGSKGKVFLCCWTCIFSVSNLLFEELESCVDLVLELNSICSLDCKDT